MPIIFFVPLQYISTRGMKEQKEILWNPNYFKAWSANFMLYFSFMLITPLLPIYLNEVFLADKHMIGVVLSGYTITGLMMRSVSGYLVDSYPRKTVLLTCWFLFFLFFTGYFITTSLLLFAIIRTLHGAPFGATAVANTTVAIDVLYPSRRAEGIGYYGLSNNIATAIAPTVGLFIYDMWHNYELIFALSLFFAGMGVVINSTIHLNPRELVRNKQPISLDRFFLLKGWSEGVNMACFSFSYGVLSTYLAIYGKEELGITGGAGLFFMLLSIGLILSRLVGGRSLRKGRIIQNATVGATISVFGYLLFAAVHDLWAYYLSALIIGLGNGHMYPAFQNMFVNLAPNNKRGTANSTLLTSWDVGIGFGTVLGGTIAEHYGYAPAFWMAWVVNLIGVIFLYAYVKDNYEQNKLR